MKKDDNDFKIDNLINYQEYVTQQLLQTKKDIESSSRNEISLNVKCDHCKTIITNRMYTLKFGEHERFFFVVMHVERNIRKNMVQE